MARLIRFFCFTMILIFSLDTFWIPRLRSLKRQAI